jgi:hypothetical protein
VSLPLQSSIYKRLTIKNFIRICIIAISAAIFRYILIEKIGLDIKQTYDFFYLSISTGIFAGIINLLYEDICISLSFFSGLPIGGGRGTGNIGIGGGAGRGNPFAVNPAVGQVNPPVANPAPVNPVVANPGPANPVGVNPVGGPANLVV